MSCFPHDPHVEPDDADDAPRPPCAEALLAATLALMTGFAEHCAAPPAEEAPTRPGQATHPAVPRLLAAKTVSNLFFLAEHPTLSVPLRSMLWRLHTHWQALERRAAARDVAPAAAPRPAAPGPDRARAAGPWIGGEPARVWH